MVRLSHFALTLLLSVAPLSAAHAADLKVRIGYQRSGNLLVAKEHGDLVERLKTRNAIVDWVEFPSGPALLEALRAGAIDLGSTGEAPPIFAQAGRAPLVYVASEPPSPRSEAIIVPRDSGITTLADLKGKRVALNKGSNVHYLLVKALEKGGVAYGDITPVFLSPSDARAAFEQGAVDAWAIWDPFLASVQASTAARTLVTGEDIVPNVTFYLASRSFAQAHGDIVGVLITGLQDVEAWEAQHPAAAAAALSAALKLPEPVVATALARQTYGVAPLTPEVTAGQQAVADAFLALKLIPKRIEVGEAVWKPGS